MNLTIICTDRKSVHEFVDIPPKNYRVKDINYNYRLVEDVLNLDKKKFEYFIDYFIDTVYVETTYDIFISNLRDSKLSDLLDIIIL